MKKTLVILALLLVAALRTDAAEPKVGFHQKPLGPIKENVLVLIHDETPGVEAYKITLRYLDANGKCQVAVQLASKTTEVSNDPNYKIPSGAFFLGLEGITVQDVSVKPLGETQDKEVTVKYEDQPSRLIRTGR